jgi:hypothetical protein
MPESSYEAASFPRMIYTDVRHAVCRGSPSSRVAAASPKRLNGLVLRVAEALQVALVAARLARLADAPAVPDQLV